MTGLTMTVAEAAQKLGVSRQWLQIEAAAGRVPSRKVGRYRRFTDQDLQDYLDSVRQGADPLARSPRSRAARRRSA
jgi:excisionase family DNA binding protein